LIDANKNKVSYDNTYKCKIVDISEAELGKYKVTSNGGLDNFVAYSENTKYKIGDNVRVTVPGNDWANPKYIDGKLYEDDSHPVAYVPPLEAFVPGGDSLFTGQGPWELTANGETSRIEIGTINNEDVLALYQIPNIYNSIGI